MILAPNHQRLSSGNSLLITLCSVLLLSCNAFKVISNDKPNPPEKSKPTVKVDTNNSVNTGSSDADVNPKYVGDMMETVDFWGEEYQVAPHKNQFKVALILPFYFHATSETEKKRSDYMLEYYQGVKLALTDLELFGLNMKLYIYDDEGSTDKLSGILDKAMMRQMDVIIGPVGESQMKMVSDFGLKHDIPVISPITGISTIDNPNPKLYSTTPSMEVKSSVVSQYIKAKYKNKKIFLVSDNGRYANEAIVVCKDQLSKAGLKYQELESKTSVFQNSLTKDDSSIVIVLSHNPSFVNRTLSSIYQTKKDVVVFGENSWSNFQDNDYKFWNKLQVHLVASDFVNDSMPSVRNFRLNFRLQNKVDPGVYAYLGYDQFRFMGEYLLAFGEHFPEYINSKEFRYLSSNFHYEYQNGLNQNTNVFLLKFEDYALKPVR